MSARREELHEAVCRLVCVPVRDYRDAHPERLLADRARHPWGGYTFFGGEREAVRGLVARLREAVSHPLLLASDLERGLGQQLAGGTSFPPPMTLGAAGDPDLAYRIGEATGREAADVGLNCVFAPVLDLAVEPENPIVGTRSFGDDPDAVAELGAATIRGLQDGGVLATAKHFPGHGRTRLDSHAALPVVRAGAAELAACDLLPFRRAVEEGVAFVMSAHVAFPALEPRTGREPTPATLSRPILHDLLRGALGFGGAVISDALIMGGVAGVEPGELAARALEAGVDCLLYPPDPAELAGAVVRRVQEGLLDEDVVRRALRRLDSVLGRPAGKRSRAVPIDPGGLALAAGRAGLVGLGDVSPPRTGGRSLVLLVLDGGIHTDEVVLPEHAAAPRREFRWFVPEEQPWSVPDDLALFDAIHLAWFSPIRAWKGRWGPSPDAAAVIAAVLRARPDATLISFSSPFILESLPPPRGAILAFGEVAACQAAVGEVLAGRTEPAGHLPVRLSGPFASSASVS